MKPRGGFTEAEWDAALSWAEYLAAVEDKRDIWLAADKRAAVEPEAVARLEGLPAARRVLVLTEDWCGDAAREVPVLARAFEAAPRVEHRYLDSDTHPAVVERYLTHGGRGIPLAIVQDEMGEELGAWGPRPAPLQALFRARQRELGAPAPEEKGAFYAPIMSWYAKDKGRAIVEEILMLLERGGEPR
ncbi:MAG: thioredoxin family protein [Planctomycetota bacterium]